MTWTDFVLLRNASIPLAALVLLGCSGQAQTRTGGVGLQGLYDTLAVALPTTDIRVGLRNGSELTVTVRKWLPPDVPRGSRLAAARRVAETVRDRYATFNGLSLVTVSFSGADSSGAVTTFVVPFRPDQLVVGDTSAVMSFESRTGP